MTVNHRVSDPSTHYIGEVTIRKNGETVIGEVCSGQPSGDTFTYRYPFILNPGDAIVSTAGLWLSGFFEKNGYLDISRKGIPEHRDDW